MADDGLVLLPESNDDGLELLPESAPAEPTTPRALTGDPALDAMLHDMNEAARGGRETTTRGLEILTGMTPAETRAPDAMIQPGISAIEGLLTAGSGAMSWLGSPLAPLFTRTMEANREGIEKPVTEATGSEFLGKSLANLLTGLEGTALAPEMVVRPAAIRHLPVKPTGVSREAARAAAEERLSDLPGETMVNGERVAPPAGAKAEPPPLDLAESQVVGEPTAQAARAAEPPARDVSTQEPPPAGTGVPPGKPPIIPPESTGGAAEPFFRNLSEDEPARAPITSDYLRSLEDDLFTDQQASHADMLEVVENLKQAPPELLDPKLQEKFYHYVEWLRGYTQADEAVRLGGPEFQTSRHFVPDVELTAAERALFDSYLEPLKQMESRLAKRAMDYGFEDVDLNYMHRRARGHAPEVDHLLTGFDTPSPQFGMRGLPTKTSSMKERKYFALQGADGSRRVVSRGPDGIAIWQQNKPFPFKFRGKLDPGEVVRVDGQPFLVTEARTSEIEQHTPVRYYKNALANTLDNVIKLRRVNRNIERLEAIKSTPEWHANAARVDENGKSLDGREIPPSWRETKLPQMKGWRMDRRMADIFDDLAGHNFNTLEETLSIINKVTIGSLFLTPIPHALNVLSHWYVARGWDNFTPMGMKNMISDGARAIDATMRLNEDYRRFLRAGAGLIDAGLENKNFYQNMLEVFGESVERDVKQYGELGTWGKISRTIGYDKVHDLVANFYGMSNRKLWQINDVFLMQRFFELERKLKGKGLSDREIMQHVIYETEKHIPNYRLPSRVGLGEGDAAYVAGRSFVQATRHPVFEFSRYHYGMWKSYAYMVKDMREAIAKVDPAKAWEVTGHMVAMGAFMTFVNVIVSAAIKGMTGNEQAHMDQPGAGKLTQVVIDYFGGDRDNLNALLNNFMLAPAPRTAVELMSGRDSFSGKDIAPATGLRGDAQLMDRALSNLLYPYGLASKAVGGESDILTDALKTFVEGQFMIKDPAYDLDAVRAKQRNKKMFMDLWRKNQPRGPLESMTR